MSSSPNHDDFLHLQIPLQNILQATNNFADENLTGGSQFEKGYEGQLLWSGELIKILARRWLKENWDDEIEQWFWMEISMLSSLKHKNVVSLVGFCDENDEKIIIYRLNTKGSIGKYLSDPMLLTWVRRLEISVGVAHALSYIHYDESRDFSVIHRWLCSATILLNDDWEPKLYGFDFSMKIKASQRHQSFHTNKVEYITGYGDPTYIETKSVNHKSDMYSFGIVLFELLCGRKAISEHPDNKYLTPMAIFHYKEKTLDYIIDPDLWKQMDPQSFKVFAQTAYDCLNEERSQRPDIGEVLTRLEEALKLQLDRQNRPEHSIVAAEVEVTSSNRDKESLTSISTLSDSHVTKDISHLKLSREYILSATNNLAQENIIRRFRFGTIRKGRLLHSEQFIDVIVKRFYFKFVKDESKRFWTEVSMLSSLKHKNLVSMRRLKICLDIAHGLNYIHTNTDQEKQKIIHRDIKSANILLGDNWVAKIADFGLSKLHPVGQKASTVYTKTIAGTDMYLDPEYEKFGRLKTKSDIYSFGVVLFEILTGRVAYDRLFTDIDKMGIAPIARHHCENGTIMEIVDLKIKEEIDEHVFSLTKGPNEQSLEIFTKIAFRCVAMTQDERPSIDKVIDELKLALHCQENHKDSLKLSLKDIKLATQNFNHDYLIGHGDSGNVYKGVAAHTLGQNNIAAKRLNQKSGHGEAEFLTELDILLEYKHENVIGLLGYCDEEDEKIIVYQYASRGSLDMYLSDESLTWVMRLRICIDIAIGMEFLHGTVSIPEMVIHRDISSSNILLFDDWKAKITDFGLSLVCPVNQDVVIDNVTGTIGYRDPLYSKTGFLTKESDIFSLGAVLFDVLCGKLSSEKVDDEYLYLPFLAKHHYHLGKLDDLVFEGIKEQIEPHSLTTFARIAYQCIHHMRERRPTAHEVVIQLKKALEFQEDYENWEPKLRKDYKEIIQMSKCPEIYSTKKKEDLYKIFSTGVLLQQDKVLLSFDGNRERNKMVSAATFSYINSCPLKWQSLPQSRFGTVAEMSDISNLNINIKANAQFLSPNVVYGVYLVFKFCDSINFSSTPAYVNLKYRKGTESQHAYFATWRDKEWMMIELDRYSNQKEDAMFEFLLESFQTYLNGDGAIYVEGIEFRAIEKMKLEDIGKSEEAAQVLKSSFNVDQLQQLPTKFKDIFKKSTNSEDMFWLGKVNGKKLLMLSAKATIFNFSDVNLYSSRRSIHCRFRKVCELLPQQVFYIKCTIESQMLSPDTEYMCYIVFKISKNCQGLHCPVKVRDLIHQENSKAEFCYFITPCPLNINEITRVPKQREDGWMEIELCKFNSGHELENDSDHSVHMKFTSQERTMSGLIVYGLEFRPL